MALLDFSPYVPKAGKGQQVSRPPKVETQAVPTAPVAQQVSSQKQKSGLLRIFDSLAKATVQPIVDEIGKSVVEMPQLLGSSGVQKQLTEVSESNRKQAEFLYNKAKDLPKGEKRTKYLRAALGILQNKPVDLKEILPASETTGKQIASRAITTLFAAAPGATVGGKALINILPKTIGSKVLPTAISKAIPRAIRGGTLVGGLSGGTALGEGADTKEALKQAGLGVLLGAGLDVGLGAAGDVIGRNLAKRATTKSVPKTAEIPVTAEVPKTTEGILQKGQTTAKSEIKVPSTSGVIDDLSGMKRRGFITSTEKNLPKSVRAIEKFNPETYYKVTTNKDTVKFASDLIKKNPDAAYELALSGTPTAEKYTTAQILTKKFLKSKDITPALTILENVSKSATTQGQAIQALSLWSKLTPEGSLRYTQGLINKANLARPNLNLKLTKDAALKIAGQAEKLAKLPEGRAKIVETAKLLDMMSGEVPATILKKVSTIQTMAQLLNPKTLIRNLVGNTGFVGLENLSQAIGTTVDVPLTAVTRRLASRFPKLFSGARTVGMPSIRTQLGGARRGLSEGFEDAVLGINTSRIPSQFDLPAEKIFRGQYKASSPIIKKAVSNMMSSLEKGLNISLRATDRAFYQAAADDSLRVQMRLAKVNKPTTEMIQIADFDGRYRTFQDDNVISNAFSSLKKGLNRLTGSNDFGLGEIVLKYPRTPGALLARGIEYSPAGFFNTVFQMTQPLIGKPFNQRAFVQSFSRALTGTGMGVGTGILLHRIGIITGKPSEDKDVRELQREIGLGEYRVNASALLRFFKSGFNVEQAKLQKGDKLLSYDWMQPFAIPFSIGANIDQNKGSTKGVVGTVASSLESGVETLTEQPLLRGLTSLFGGYDLPQQITRTLETIPSSFIPTLFSQIRMLVDNTRRNIRVNGQDPVTTMVNSIMYKIPFLSKNVPPRVGIFGTQKPIYEQSQTNNKLRDGLTNIFNVFVNPAFVNTYNPTPESDMVLSIMNSTGVTSHFPRVLNNNLRVYGQSLQLDSEQLAELQTQVGLFTQEAFSEAAQNERFLRLPDEQKAKELGSMLTDIGSMFIQSFVVKETQEKGLLNLPFKKE
jgi:hypothetical protein